MRSSDADLRQPAAPRWAPDKADEFLEDLLLRPWVPRHRSRRLLRRWLRRRI